MLLSGSVVIRLFFMDFAIDFDDQASFRAYEVDDVAFESDLAAKPEAVELLSTQSGLEFLLSWGQAFSELAGRGVEFFGRVAVAVLASNRQGSLPRPSLPDSLVKKGLQRGLPGQNGDTNHPF